MSIKKNPGPPLTSVYKGVLDAIPLRWRAKLGLTKVVQEQPVDIEPSPLTDTLVASSVEQERTDERRKTDTKLSSPLGGTMIEYVRTKDGQVGKRTVKYVPEGTAPPTFDELLKEFNQDASGNGWSEQITVTVPNLFGGNDYSIERPDRVPPDFGALLQATETAVTVAGTAAAPTLGVGELMRSEKQLDVQTKRITVRARDISTLPKTLVDKETDKDKQVVTVTRVWELDTTTPQVPTDTKDVAFDKLGDGTALETRRVVPTVFDSIRYEAEVPDLIPPEFRDEIPVVSTEQTLSGNASPPVISGNIISASDHQETEFTHRIKQATRNNPTFPVTRSGQETTEEFGGGVLDVTRIVNNAALTIDTGLRVTSSFVKRIGSALYLKETKQNSVADWSTLISKPFDEEMQKLITKETQIVATGYTPAVPTAGVDYFLEYTEEVDWERVRRIKITRQPNAIDESTAIESTIKEPYRFPGLVYPVAGGYYVRRASAQLTEVKVKTWWVSSATKPVIVSDDIIMDNIIISTLNDTSKLEYSGDVLHDNITTFGTFFYPATTPSYSQYTGVVFKPGTVAFTSGSANVVGTGTNFTTLPVGAKYASPQSPFAILSITDDTHLTLTIPFPDTIASLPSLWADTSISWMGNEKITAATVTPTNIPNLWKIQTKTIVMR